MSFSLSARLLMDTPQVTGSPAAFASRMMSAEFGAGDHRRVIAAAGQAHETHVALEHHRLGLARNARKAKARREFALVHHALPDEIRILHVVDDEGVEIARIGQSAPHHLRVGDRAGAVRERDRAGLLEQTDLGHSWPASPLVRAAAGTDMDDGRIARAPQNEIDHGRIVDDRVGVRHRNDGRNAARRRRLAGAFQRLAMRRSRFADERPHVDQARRQHLSAAIDEHRVGGSRSRAHLGDRAIDHQHAATLLAAGRGIDEPGIGQQQGAISRRHAKFPRPLPARGKCSPVRQMARESLEHRHADGDAHLDLFADQRLRAVGDVRRDLDAAIHRPRMHHQRVRLCPGKLFLIETVEAEILLDRRDEGAVHALALQAQHHDDVGAFEAASHIGEGLEAEALDAGRQQGRGRDQPNPRAQSRRAGCMLERATRECRMSPQIATVRPAIRPLLRRIVSASSSAWVGMLMRAVAGIDHRAIHLLRQQMHRSRRVMAHDDEIGPHGVERRRGVDQRLALLHRGRRHRHVHDVGAEPLAGDLERGLRAGRRLEEQVDLGAAAKRRFLLLDLPADLDLLVGEVEKRRR